ERKKNWVCPTRLTENRASALLIIQLIAFSVGPIIEAPRIDSAQTPPDVAKAMSDDLFGASDVRQRDYVASDGDVALLTQLPEREGHVIFRKVFMTRTQKPGEFIQRNAGVTLRESLLKDGDGERLQFRERFVLFRWRRLSRG